VDYDGIVLNDFISTTFDVGGAKDILRTKDGGIAYVSNWTNDQINGYKIYLEKLDSNFNSEWIYKLEPHPNFLNFGVNIDQNETGDMFINGTHVGVFDFKNPDSSGVYGFLQKMSLQGDSLWHQKYFVLNNSLYDDWHLFDDIEIHNNKIFMVGQTQDLLKPLPPQQETWLVQVDSNGCLVPGCLVGIEKEKQFPLDLNVYPNPTKDLLNIQLDNSSVEASFMLYDLQGRLLIAQKLSSNQRVVSLEKVPQGLYIYEVQKGEKVKRGKVVKE
jgi:hypothetical protein